MDHEKRHYRLDENGVVRYDENGSGKQAPIHKRTAIGKHRDGSVYVRATDSEDLAKIKEVADTLGVGYRQRRGGASHHGRIGSYEHLHFDHISDALNVHAALAYHLEDDGKEASHDDHLAKLASGMQHHVQGKDSRVDGCMVNTRTAHQMSLDAGKSDTPDAHRSAAQLHRLSAEAHRSQASRPWVKGEGAHHAGLAILHDAIARQHDGKAVSAHKRIQAELRRQAEMKAKMEAMEEGRETKKALVHAHARVVKGKLVQVKEHQDSRHDRQAAFDKWFSGSKVVDPKGNPLVVYHGTTKTFDKFRIGNGSLVYFSDNPKESDYYSEGEGGRHIPVYLSIKNPYRTDDADWLAKFVSRDEPYHAAMREIDRLKAEGYDGIVGPSQGTTLFGDKVPLNYLPFDPGQIKSALANSGDFDSSNPSIMKAHVEGDKYVMGLDEAISEHKDLVRALETPSKKDDAEEAEEQGAEMEEMREARKNIGTVGAGTDLSTLEGGGALRAENHDEEMADATMSAQGSWDPKVRLAALEARRRPVQKAGLDLDPLPEPTPAQIEAGNYKVHKVNVQGLEISIENPKGSIRRGVGNDGHEWETKMVHDYGYFRRAHSDGPDGDPVDCFVGPDLENPYVHVINQVDPKTGRFDEFKCMLGFNSREAAIEGYLANYEKGWRGLGDVKTMHVDDFKQWLKHGDLKHRLIYKAANTRLHTVSRVQMQYLRMHPGTRVSAAWTDALQCARTAGLTDAEILRTVSNATGAFAPLVNHLKGKR